MGNCAAPPKTDEVHDEYGNPNVEEVGYGDQQPAGYGDQQPAGYGDAQPGYGDAQPGYADTQPQPAGYGDQQQPPAQYGGNDVVDQVPAGYGGQVPADYGGQAPADYGGGDVIADAYSGDLQHNPQVEQMSYEPAQLEYGVTHGGVTSFGGGGHGHGRTGSEYNPSTHGQYFETMEQAQAAASMGGSSYNAAATSSYSHQPVGYEQAHQSYPNIVDHQQPAVMAGY